ncbi:MAG: phage antirepressor N-terminal domain-containing protein [Anaerolineae bacterium]|nr:phage antirepressor N-terminal domain-containing protein [Anaerolineae bacterium]
MPEQNSASNTTLIPLEQRQVLFYDDEVTAVLVADGERRQIYVPLRPLVDNLGLAWSGQYERLQRDAVLSEEIRSVRVTRTEPGRSASQETAEVSREMVCLPLDYLNGWLFGINASRVKSEIRERLIRYQRECYHVLHEAFVDGRLSGDPNFADLLRSDSPAAQAYRIASAMMRLARQQLVLEAQVESQGEQLADHERRLEEVEATLGDPGRHITPEQASQISQAVKAVAMALSKRSGRNEYGGVYGEFYRRFGITGYKLLPARRFDDAMAFLSEWYQSLEGDVPF